MKQENVVLSNTLVKVELPPCTIWKADVSSFSPSSDSLCTVVIRLSSKRLIKPNFPMALRASQRHCTFWFMSSVAVLEQRRELTKFEVNASTWR